MKKTIYIAIILLISAVGSSYAQENPYAAQTTIIKNEQSIANLRQQQANLYLKIENLLVKYGELKGRLDDITRRLEAIEARLNSGAYANNKPTHPIVIQKPKAEIKKEKPKLTQPLPQPQLAQKQKPAAEPTEKQNSPQQAQANIQPLVVNDHQKQKQGVRKQPQKTDKEIFDEAKRLYDKKLFSEAIKMFNMLKDQYKDSQYVPDAIFLIAESYFNKKVYDKAIINYDYLINTYPKNKNVPRAVLKEGISFINLGDNIDGKYLLKKVIADYPQSKEAKDAKKYLLRIK